MELQQTNIATTLRSITSTWFECKVSYQKTVEDGTVKMVNETYTVDAFSFTEAEERILYGMTDYEINELKVADISRAKYGEVFFSDSSEDDLWFKARVAFITIDEKTKKEKRSYTTYLVQAKSLERARKYVDMEMRNGMADYELKSLSETKILDVFEYGKA